MSKFVTASSTYATMKEAVEAALNTRVDAMFEDEAFIGEMYKKHPGRKDHADQKKHAGDEESEQADKVKDDVENPSNAEKGGDVKGSSSRKADD